MSVKTIDQKEQALDQLRNSIQKIYVQHDQFEIELEPTDDREGFSLNDPDDDYNGSIYLNIKSKEDLLTLKKMVDSKLEHYDEEYFWIRLVLKQ